MKNDSNLYEQDRISKKCDVWKLLKGYGPLIK